MKNLFAQSVAVQRVDVEAPFFYSPNNLALSSVILFALLLPVYALAAGRLGYKLPIALVSCAAIGYLTESLGALLTKKRVVYYGFSIWILYPLLVPPGMPLWMILIEFFFAIVITEVFFGGFGRQCFHPAVVAQVFLMVNFLRIYNGSFLEPFQDPFFGFFNYSSLSLTEKTTLIQLKSGIEWTSGGLFLGPIVGSAGDMFPFVIGIIGSLYLIFGGVNRITPIAFLVSLIFFSYFGHLVLPDRILPVIPTLFGGSALFYLFFIFSDRWTSSKTRKGRVICGAFAGFLTILIRHFSINVEGVIFSAMFNYAFSPLFDEIAFSIQNRREAREFRAETKGVGS